jgi:acetyltransferase EpsM
MRELIVVGGGEHARVVIEAARSQPSLWSVIGFLDRGPCEATVRLGVPRLGDDDDAPRLLDGERQLALGVGSIGVTTIRQRVADRYRSLADHWATIVHARAWVSPTATLGPGVVVLAGAIVNAATNLGAYCVLNTGAIVEHDCSIGAFAQLGPGAIVGGGARVGDGSFLGIGCRVRDHVHIGSNATVGMGAVVLGPVLDGQVVAGVPARVIGSHG